MPDPPARLPDPLPAGFARTRDELHRLAVYVISPAQRLATGEIVLRPAPGGFSTHEFDGGPVGVDGAELIVAGSRRPITSLRAAADAAGIAPDVGEQERFDVPPHGDLDAPLEVDAAAVHALGGWYAFAWELLERLRAGFGGEDEPTAVRIWPEHFDAAFDAGAEASGRRATYGASPGDRHHDQPYLYVSPWAGRVDGFFADPGFRGAALVHRELSAAARPADAGLAFLREARTRIAAAG